MLIVAMFAIIAIISQAKFATFAIAKFADIAKSPAMDDPQRELKLWLAAKVAPHGTGARLVAATRFTPDRITRSKELESGDPKKRRRISHEEIQELARFFGELPPGYEENFSWLDPKDSRPPDSAGEIDLAVGLLLKLSPDRQKRFVADIRDAAVLEGVGEILPASAASAADKEQ